MRGSLGSQVQQFWIGSRYDLEVLQQGGKGVKAKSHKALGANSYFYIGKNGRGHGKRRPPIRGDLEKCKKKKKKCKKGGGGTL